MLRIVPLANQLKSSKEMESSVFSPQIVIIIIIFFPHGY